MITLYKKGSHLWLSQHINILETSVWPMGTIDASLGGPTFSSTKHLIKHHIRTAGSVRLKGCNLGDGKDQPLSLQAADRLQPNLSCGKPHHSPATSFQRSSLALQPD